MFQLLVNLYRKITKWCNLAVGINYRSEQLPGSSPSVHTQHAQDLQKSQTSDGRGGKNIALRSSCQYGYWGYQHHNVWRKNKTHSLNSTHSGKQGKREIASLIKSDWIYRTLLCATMIDFVVIQKLFQVLRQLVFEVSNFLYFSTFLLLLHNLEATDMMKNKKEKA